MNKSSAVRQGSAARSKGANILVRSISSLVLLFAGLSIFVASTFSPAKAVTITFNQFPNGTSIPFGTVITTQFASVGALFSVSGSAPATIVDIRPDAAVAGNVNISPSTFLNSPPNGLRINGGQPFADVLHVDFVDPTNSAIPADMTSVSFSFVSDAPGIGSITAFDASNNQVDQAISVLGNPDPNLGQQEFEILTVTGAAIRRVEIDGFADVIIDDLIFTAIQPGSSGIAEPGTLALFGFGLAGLGFARRRKVA